MAEKRRLSTRVKGEPLAKRKASTSVKEKPAPTKSTSAKGTPAKNTPTRTTPAVEALPTKVIEGKPLPTLDEPQPLDLPSKAYQSIAESGVLAAALQRSRSKWVNNGIFEKYWSKPPPKKKDKAGEVEKPQAGQADKTKDGIMRKAGTCELTIEPHVFDVTLWVVKDPTTPTAQSYGQPLERPHLQYGPPPGYGAPYYQHSPHYPAQAPRTPSQPPNDPSLKLPPLRYPTPQQPLTNPQSQPGPLAAARVPPAVQNTPTQGNTPTMTATPTATPQQAAPDPVIHMLAARASTNLELKAVMKIVATGNATPAQLEYFQKHIDELSEVVEARKNANKPTLPTASPALKPGSAASSPAIPAAPNSAVNGHTLPSPATTRPSTPASASAPYSSTPQPAPAPPYHAYHHQQPPAARKPPAPSPEIKHVLLEFSSNPSDRFLLPRYSILEYQLSSRTCLASFLIIRKGSDATDAAPAGRYDPALDYYQPVTVRFVAADEKVLGVLAKGVAPPERVREWMEEVMRGCTRAEYVHLAVRLPREGEGEAQGEGGEAMEVVEGGKA